MYSNKWVLLACNLWYLLWAPWVYSSAGIISVMGVIYSCVWLGIIMLNVRAFTEDR